MANWCNNFVTFTGRKGNINKLYSKLEALKQQQIDSGGNGVSLLPASQVGKYMFYLDIDEPNDNDLTIRFETKWYVSFADFEKICNKFKVNIRCDFEECGMGIYGTYEYNYSSGHSVHREIPDDVIQSIVEDDDGLVTYNNKTYGCLQDFIEDYFNKMNKYEEKPTSAIG